MDVMTPLSTLHDALAMWAERDPGRPALILPRGESLSYGDLAGELATLRAQLRESGIGPGDRVAFSAGADLRSAMLVLATRGAAVAVPLPPEMTEGELARVIPRLRPKVVIAGADERLFRVARAAGVPVLDPAPLAGNPFRFRLTGDPAGPPSSPGDPHLDDLALIIVTSGTTGVPKLVPRSHRMLAISQQVTGRMFQLRPEDCTVLSGALSHALGQHVLGPQLAAGGSLACPASLDAAALERMLAIYPVNHLTLAPALLAALVGNYLQAGTRPPTQLRAIRVSSARLDQSLREQAEAVFGAPVLDAYGCTEVVNIAGYMLDWPRRPGTVGRAMMPIRIMVGDSPALDGLTGEIQLRGDNVFAGYFDDPAATASAFTADGWFRTGDLGRIEDGHLVLAGRMVETINAGGRKVDPLEVEAALAGFPGIAEAAAFAVADPSRGERIGLAVVPQTGAEVNARALRRHLLERLSPWKTPTIIRQLDAMPRTANGKVKRASLAELVDPEGPPGRPGGAQAGGEA